MFRLLKFTARWSLEISGASILYYNECLSQKKQYLLRGLFYSATNTCRALAFLYRTHQQYKQMLLDTTKEKAQQLKQFNDSTAQKLLQLCNSNRGVYARMGQHLSHLRHILPEAYTAALSKIIPYSNSYVEYENAKPYLEGQLGKPLKEMFETFKTQPVQFDLTSQTYRGELITSFKNVLLRMKLPYIEAQYKYDLLFINKAKDYLLKRYLQESEPSAEQQRLKQLSAKLLDSVVESIEKQVKEELNYDQEVKSVDDFRETVKDIPIIYVPQFLKNYCNANVTLKEEVAAFSPTDQESLATIGLSPRIAFAMIGSAVVGVLKKHEKILKPFDYSSIRVRKYVPPPQPDGVVATSPEASKVSLSLNKQKEKILAMLPSFQVVVDGFPHAESVGPEVAKSILGLWKEFLSLKKGMGDFKGFSAEGLYRKYIQARSGGEKKKPEKKEEVGVDGEVYYTSKLYDYEWMIELYDKVSRPAPKPSGV